MKNKEITISDATWYFENNPIDLQALVDVWHEDHVVCADKDEIKRFLLELFTIDSSCISLSESPHLFGNSIDKGSKSDKELHNIKLLLVDQDFSASYSHQECKISLPCLVSLLNKRNIEYPAILGQHFSTDVVSEELSKIDSPADNIIFKPTDGLLAEMTEPTYLMEAMCKAHKAINTKDKERYSKKSVAVKKKYLQETHRIKKSEANHIHLVIDSKNSNFNAPTPLMEIVAKAHNHLWHTVQGKKLRSQSERLTEIKSIDTTLSDNLAKAILNIISPPVIKAGGLKKLKK